MLKNYITIALRNIARNKLFAFLNIFGLAIGIVSCLLIYIYIQDELSFDAHHSKAKKIYRVQSFFKFNDTEDKFGITSFLTGPTLKQDYPEIKDYTRLFLLSQQNMGYNGQTYNIDNAYLADSNFFSVFDFDFIAGNPQEALKEQYSMIITDVEAKKIFGTDDPMGKIITWSNKSIKITGIIDSKKYNTHIELGCFISMNSMRKEFRDIISSDWGNNNSFTYLVMDESAANNFQPKLDAFVNKYMVPFWGSIGFNGKINLHLEPLREIHFNNYLIYDTPKKGNKAYVTILSVVALLILFIACINYVNMSTAAATRRAKEVGVRKVAGAGRTQLIVQFLSESIIITILAIIVSLALLEISLPLFNEITGKEITLKYLLKGSFILVILGIITVVGVLAGSYPAFFLSGFKPTVVLKRLGEVKGGGAGIRKVLITGQFAIAIFMIAGVLAVYSQLHYMITKDIGINTNNMLAIQIPQTGRDTLLAQQIRNVKDEYKKLSFTKGATFTDNLPGKQISRIVYKVRSSEGKPMDKPITTAGSDADFPQLVGMKLVEGRFFDETIDGPESNNIIINESCAKAFGWNEPLKEKLLLPGDTADIPLNIVGVVKDYNFASLHSPIEPLVIFMNDKRLIAGYMLINLQGGNLQEQVEQLKNKWAQMLPNKEFKSFFLDESIEEMYTAESKMLRVFIYFAVLTIILSCMGIYGLSYFITRRRAREIGIRKVLGAPVTGILFLLNKEFLWLILVASAIAIPLSYWAISNWLLDFSYHITISYTLFVGAVLLTIIVAVTTISLQALRTAIGNPVNSIRYE